MTNKKESVKEQLEKYPYKYKRVKDIHAIEDLSISILTDVSINVQKDIKIIEAIQELEQYNIDTQTEHELDKINSKTQALSLLIFQKDNQFPKKNFTLLETTKSMAEAIRYLRQLYHLPMDHY